MLRVLRQPGFVGNGYVLVRAVSPELCSGRSWENAEVVYAFSASPAAWSEGNGCSEGRLPALSSLAKGSSPHNPLPKPSLRFCLCRLPVPLL